MDDEQPYNQTRRNINGAAIEAAQKFGREKQRDIDDLFGLSVPIMLPGL